MKSGWKTTEFWLSLAAAVVGSLLAAGAFPAESPWARALGALAASLAAVGYSASRGAAKRGNAP